VQKTNAIGLIAKAGRYGGTYAHADIAFEFGMWISAEFKIYLVKEFQRLKEIEGKELVNLAMKLHLFAVAQHARNRWHNITEISNLAKPPNSGVTKTPMKKEISATMPTYRNWFAWQTSKILMLFLLAKACHSTNALKS